jgi:hypothetical protein
VYPVKYELCFYIAEDGILHRHRRGNLKYYRSFIIYAKTSLSASLVPIFWAYVDSY